MANIFRQLASFGTASCDLNRFVRLRLDLKARKPLTYAGDIRIAYRDFNAVNHRRLAADRLISQPLIYKKCKIFFFFFKFKKFKRIKFRADNLSLFYREK